MIIKHLYFSLFTSTFLLMSCQSKSISTAKDGVINDNIRDIELIDALAMMSKAGVITIDIRTPEEIAQGKIIDSALEMNFYGNDFKSKIGNLDKNSPYVIYCRSGGRSGKTLKMMKDSGFKEVYNILGGYNGFVEHKK